MRVIEVLKGRMRRGGRGLLGLALLFHLADSNLAWAQAGSNAPSSSNTMSGEAVVAARVVSLNPSLTEILVAVGAVSVLVGVDDYSAQVQPEVRSLPRVGGLFNPSLESVVALEPDLVVMVPGAEQRDLANRLRRLGVDVLELPNVRSEDLLQSIEILGGRVGRREAARRNVARIRLAWRAVEKATARRSRVRAVLVLERDPLFLVGSGSFLDEMLRAAGGENVAAVLSDPYPQAAIEWLIAAAPQVILDATDDPGDPLRYWSRWPSLPAVVDRRAIAISPAVLRPGPYLDRSLRILAEALHGVDVLATGDGETVPSVAP
ncbi:MAG: helical backbone metal receptor [Myxococcota bacterium]